MNCKRLFRKEISKVDKILNFITLIVVVFIIIFNLIILKEGLDTRDWELLFINEISDIYDSKNNDAEVFFNSSWGDSIEDVLKDNEFLELGKKVTDINKVKYYRPNNYIGGLESNIFFNFEDNIFSFGEICWDNEYSNFNYYIEDYDMIKSLLIEEFGEPLFDNIEFIDSGEDFNGEDYVSALNNGEIKFCTGWQIKNVEIVLEMFKPKTDSNLTLSLFFNPNNEGGVIK